MTVEDLITAALRRIRVISGSDAPDGDTEVDALARFNDWIDDLKNENLMVYARLRTLWTLSSVASYSVGTGGAVNIGRPTNALDIENIGFVDNSFSTPTEIMLGPPLTEDAYAAIPQKTATSSYPIAWYYNPTYPLGALKPWPIPTSSTLQGVIYTGIGVDEFTLPTVLSLPPGYRRFLRDGLAIELFPEFPSSDTSKLPMLAASRDEARDNIKRTNTRLWDLTPPDSTMLFRQARSSNIYTDT